MSPDNIGHALTTIEATIRLLAWHVERVGGLDTTGRDELSDYLDRMRLAIRDVHAADQEHVQ